MQEKSERKETYSQRWHQPGRLPDKAAVDTFGHVDVLNRVSSLSPEGKIVPTVFGGSSRAILSRLTLNGDGKSRTDCLAQFTRYPEIQISIR